MYCVELIYSLSRPLQWVVDGGHGEGLCPFWSRQVWKLWRRNVAFIMWVPRSHLALFQVLLITVAAVPTQVSTPASSALPSNKDGCFCHLHFNLAAVWQFHQLGQQRSHTQNDHLLSEYALGGIVRMLSWIHRPLTQAEVLSWRVEITGAVIFPLNFVYDMSGNIY